MSRVSPLSLWPVGLLTLTLLMTWASPLSAQPDPGAGERDSGSSPPPPPSAVPPPAPPPAVGSGAGRLSSRARVVDRQPERKTLSTKEYEARMRRYINSNNSSLTLYQVVNEMLDDLLADVRDLQLDAVGPLAIRGVGLSPNLSPLFGQWVEGEVTARLIQATKLTVRYCTPCQSLRTDVEGGEWVLRLGWTEHEDMRKAAASIGVSSFMDIFVSFVPGANQVMLTVRIYRADNGAILWAESYTSDSTTAAILRTGERVMNREEAYRELTRKIEQRPYYGYTIYFGGGMIPFAGPEGDIDFNTIGIRFYEKFGEDKRSLFGIVAESAISLFSTNPLMAAFFGGILQHRVNSPNLNDIQLWAGGAMEVFVAGLQGNTLAFEGNVDLIMQFRLGFGASVYYAVPVDFGGADIGGVGYKFRFTFHF